VRRLKGSERPINEECARASILDALSIVDCVVIFNEDTPEKLLSLLTPDIIAKGGDYTPEQVAGGRYAKEVVILPILEGYSTTGIIRKQDKR
jgi:D-beta-D-heptose 7-phosphate kinase/D-beta-D-heptose 1-phosphate adenosyltransferase